MESPIQNKFAFFGGLAYFVAMLAFFCIKLFAYFGLINFPGANYVFKIVIQIGLMFVLPLVLFSVFTKTNPKKTFSYFSFKKVSSKTVLLSFLLGICVFVLVFFVSNFWSNLLSLFGYKSSGSGSADYSPLSFVLGLLLSCFLPAICEETTHRGMALFSMKKNGAVRAILFSGFLFGLMHFNVVQFGYAFLVGIFFGGITMLTKSIFPAMIMHFTNNALSLVWNYSVGSDWLSNNLVNGILNFFETSSFAAGIFLEISVLCVVLWFVYFLVIKMFQESKKAAFFRFKKKFAEQIKASKLEKEIDINNNEQIFQIYRNTQLLKLQEQLEQDGSSVFEAVNTGGPKALEFLFNDGFKKKQKAKKFDYLFYYLALVLGIGGTVWTFVLGVL